MSDSYGAVIRDLAAMLAAHEKATNERAAETAAMLKALGAAVGAVMASHPDPASLRTAWAAHVQPVAAMLPEGATAARSLLDALTASLAPETAH